MKTSFNKVLTVSTALSPLYWHYARGWAALGDPAFVAMAVVPYLMANKPSLGF